MVRKLHSICIHYTYGTGTTVQLWATYYILWSYHSSGKILFELMWLVRLFSLFLINKNFIQNHASFLREVEEGNKTRTEISAFGFLENVFKNCPMTYIYNKRFKDLLWPRMFRRTQSHNCKRYILINWTFPKRNSICTIWFPRNMDGVIIFETRNWRSKFEDSSFCWLYLTSQEKKSLHCNLQNHFSDYPPLLKTLPIVSNWRSNSSLKAKHFGIIAHAREKKLHKSSNNIVR